MMKIDAKRICKIAQRVSEKYNLSGETRGTAGCYETQK